MILVHDFKKAYGSTLAVAGLTFEVTAGQVWGLVGHNGAGKTTTMRAIAGLLPPSAGELSVNGFDVCTRAIESKRHLAYMPDDPQLFESLTVSEHLRFTAAAYQIENYADEASRLLDFFELAEKADTPAEDLSRGMRQKLAICCGYLHKPTAILFDEPFTGLDPLAIRRLKKSIAGRAESGAAVIVSSHLLAMVEDLCTHFLMLAKGRPTFCGTHDELFKEHGQDASLEEVFFRATDLARMAATETQVSQREQIGKVRV